MNAVSFGVRVASIGTAAAAAVAVGFSGTANADTVVPLPGGSITRAFADGTVVTVRLTDESALISPSMGATPLHRNAWVSGSASAEISGPGASGGEITPGYIVACQLNLGGGGGVDSGDGGLDLTGAPVVPSPSTTADIVIGPGEAQSLPVLGSSTPANKFTGNSGSVTWTDWTIGLSGCAGYAQARSFVKVTVDTDTVSGSVTLWGQPFSIG